MARILLVDDEASILSVLSTLFKAEGYEVVTALGGDKALQILKNDKFDLMLSDIRMSPVDGMQLLKVAHDDYPKMAVLMLTAYGSVETAIEALKLGAFDYVTKPFKIDELLITVERALEYNRTLTENVELKAEFKAQCSLGNIIAESAAMKNVCQMIERVAPTDTTVLIYGESGTGKELVAKAIHANSRRKDKNFLAVNCAALPEPLLESEMFGHVKGAFTGASADKKGLFEAANGGTIFLDEIGSMPLAIQGKLLRVLQEKEVRRVGSNETTPVDVRVLAATNTDLESLMKESKFREDLYFRLSVIPIEVKPLRERREDIIPLASHFLGTVGGEGKTPLAIDPEVWKIFEQYAWPGNVRELENAVKHAVMFAKDGKIGREALPPKIGQVSVVAGAEVAGKTDLYRGKSLKGFLRVKEKEYLEHVLAHTKGDKEKAAEALRISLSTLYRKLPEDKTTPDSQS